MALNPDTVAVPNAGSSSEFPMKCREPAQPRGSKPLEAQILAAVFSVLAGDKCGTKLLP